MKNKIDIVNAIIIFIMVSFKYLKMYDLFSEMLLYGYLAILIIFVIANIYKMELSKKEYLMIVMLLAFAGFTFITNRDVNLLVSIFVALLFLKRDNKEFVKYFIWSSVFMFCTTVILNASGLLDNKSMIRNTEDGRITRHALGFESPNAVFLYFMPIMFAFYYLYGTKKKAIMVFAIFGTTLFYLTNCRTGFILTVLFLIYIVIYKNKMPKNIKKLLPYLFLVFTIITIAITIYYSNTKDDNLDKMLSGRPALWNYYYGQGLHKSITGGNLNEEYILDNFYLHIMVHLGIIAYIFYLLVYYKSSKKLEKDERALNILLFYLLYGLVETNTVLASTNFILVLQFKSLILDTQKKEKKNGARKN